MKHSHQQVQARGKIVQVLTVNVNCDFCHTLVPHSFSRRRVENFIFLTVEKASKSVLAVG
jgi:hypothetical protein